MVEGWVIILDIIAKVGRVGKPLREVEDYLINKYGMSKQMAAYWMRKLKNAGWIRYRRPFRTSKKIWVEPRRPLIHFIVSLCEPEVGE